MSGYVKLKATLPPNDRNGLVSVAPELTRHPHELIPVIAYVDCETTTIHEDTGERVPTARIRRIEPIPAKDRAAARRLLTRAIQQRTGRAELPADVQQEIDLAFETSHESEV